MKERIKETEMKNKFLLVALILLMLLGSLFIMGCESAPYILYGMGSQFSNTSCANANDCNGNSYYCGRSTCTAARVNSSTRCACL